MRSQEGVGGPGTAVAARGPSGREKLPALEGQFRHESPRQEPETPPASSSGCGGGVGKHREEKTTALSKVVVRRLPPGLTQEQLEQQLRPLPAHDYFEFFAADLRCAGECASARRPARGSVRVLGVRALALERAVGRRPCDDSGVTEVSPGEFQQPLAPGRGVVRALPRLVTQ
uniref:UPF3 domain-containing protein n=1 Tax=Prolemur simus TaxID=1328070 RepID=A0A8C9AEW3_PROSS